MKKSNKRVVSDFPRPYDCERQTDFYKRWTANQDVKHKFGTLVNRINAAEQEWKMAKSQSLVSVRTAEDEFLLFGRL